MEYPTSLQQTSGPMLPSTSPTDLHKPLHRQDPELAAAELTSPRSEYSGDLDVAGSLYTETHPQMTGELRRGAPGDPNHTRISQRSAEEARLARYRSQRYDEMFGLRESHNTFQGRATKDSIITAEVKTNVIVRDEYTFLTSLSTYLAELYARPESSIAIALQHSTCVLMAGTFDPAYIVTVSALPELLTPTINKRNTSLIQHLMQEQLAVPFDRGILRFVAIADTCLATNGNTLRAKMDDSTAAAADARRHGELEGTKSSTGSWRSSWRNRHGGAVAPDRSGRGAHTAGAMAGAAGTAVASVASNIFGRNKSGRRGLQEQEGRRLLNGKAREGTAALASSQNEELAARVVQSGGRNSGQSQAHQRASNIEGDTGQLDADLRPSQTWDQSDSARSSFSNRFRRRKTSSSGGEGHSEANQGGLHYKTDDMRRGGKGKGKDTFGQKAAHGSNPNTDEMPSTAGPGFAGA